jgi:hypothetical protein
MSIRAYVWTAGLIFAISGSIAAQEQSRLTARELFYGAGRKPAAAQPEKAQPAKAAKAAPPAAQPAASSGDKTPPPTAARPATESPSQPTVINANYSPLGLRYSLLRRTGISQYEEVDVDTTFRSGDGMRLTVESNDDAYLYLVNKGSSGTWSVLFPSSQIDNGNNHVQAHRRYQVPAGGQFTFEAPAGEERLFLVLSREPETDLERLIYSLSKPGVTPNRSDQPKILSVQAINDDLIGRIRNTVIARDLVFEKVDDRTSSRKEKAAYVVNASASSSGRVIADLSLKHQ